MLMLIFGSNISAQGQGRPQGPPQMNPEEAAKKRTDWITKELALDKTTSDKVYQIELKALKAMKEQMDNGQGKGMDAMRTEMDKIRATRRSELKALLGDEKYAIIEQKEAEMRQQGPPQGGPH